MKYLPVPQYSLPGGHVRGQTMQAVPLGVSTVVPRQRHGLLEQVQRNAVSREDGLVFGVCLLPLPKGLPSRAWQGLTAHLEAAVAYPSSRVLQAPSPETVCRCCFTWLLPDTASPGFVSFTQSEFWQQAASGHL